MIKLEEHISIKRNTTQSVQQQSNQIFRTSSIRIRPEYSRKLVKSIKDKPSVQDSSKVCYITLEHESLPLKRKINLYKDNNKKFDHSDISTFFQTYSRWPRHQAQ